jgi:RNA polymerase sigma factor (TIGR02999 family)
MSDLTDILRKVSSGEDPNAANELMNAVYEKLHDLAVGTMRRQPPGHTCQPTDLVHELWLKLFGKAPNRNFASQKHFFCTAAKAMRQILVGYARRRDAKKRGERVNMSTTEFANLAHEAPDELLLAVDEALDLFKKKHERTATLIELKFFMGLPMEECAKVLGISLRSAEKHYTFFKAWFCLEFGNEMSH